MQLIVGGYDDDDDDDDDDDIEEGKIICIQVCVQKVHSWSS